MVRFLILIGLVAGGFAALQGSVNVNRIPMELVWFGIATTGVIWALRKI